MRSAAPRVYRREQNPDENQLRCSLRKLTVSLSLVIHRIYIAGCAGVSPEIQWNSVGIPLVLNLRILGLLIALIGLGAAVSPMRSYAQWWKLYTPKDFEECSQSAEQPGLTKDAQAKIISECDSKFPARRKPGGGYTYYDFMQNLHFDVAGPKPTPQELQRMDQHYLTYLESNRQASAEVVEPGQALAAINSQIKTVRYQKPARPKVPAKPAVAVARKNTTCKKDALTCGWAKITVTVKDLRQVLLGSENKQASGQRKL